MKNKTNELKMKYTILNIWLFIKGILYWQLAGITLYGLCCFVIWKILKNPIIFAIWRGIVIIGIITGIILIIKNYKDMKEKEQGFLDKL